MPDDGLVYWDSDVFIHRLEGTPDKIDILRHITDRAEQGELRIATSAFALCEVAKLEGLPLPDEQERMIVEFFDNPYIVVVQVDRFVALKSRDITRRFGLKGKDAVHVASALLAPASVMHTYDESHILKLNGLVGDPPLRIERPGWKAGQPPLPRLEVPGAP